MCVIIDNENRVVSISLIHGLMTIPPGYKIIFPWNGDLPQSGATLTNEQLKQNGIA